MVEKIINKRVVSVENTRYEVIIRLEKGLVIKIGFNECSEEMEAGVFETKEEYVGGF